MVKIITFTLLKKLLKSIASIGLIMGGIITFFMCTTTGATIALKVTNYFSPYEIKAEKVEGTLHTHLTLSRLHIEDKQITLNLEKITLDWDPLEVLFNRLRFNDISTQDLNIHFKTKPSDKLPTKELVQDIEKLSDLPNLSTLHQHLQALLPIKVIVDKFTAKNTHIKIHDTPTIIQNITFTSGASHRFGFFEKLTINSEFGTINLHHKNNNFELKWNLAIKDSEIFTPYSKGDLTTEGLIEIPDVNQNKISKINFNLNSNNFLFQGIQYNNFKFSVNGTAQQQNISINGIINQHTINTIAIGQKSKNSWTLTVDKFKVTSPTLGTLPYSSGSIILHHKEKTKETLAQLNLTLLGNNPFSANIIIKPNRPFKLNGNFFGKITDLKHLAKVIPEIDQINGSAYLNLKIGGTLLKPKVWGNAKLNKIDFPLPTLGTKLNLDTIELNGTPNGILNINGTGTMGDGHFTLSGKTNFTGDQPLVNLSMVGENLTLSNTPEYFIVANPNLKLSLKNGQPRITGEIHLPQAKVATQTFTKSHITPSDDVVIIKSKHKATEQQTPAPSKPKKFILTNINVTLGEKAYYKGFGLDAHVKGNIAFNNHSGQFKANGKLTAISGKYRTRGTILDLEHAQLSYVNAPFNNPMLDVKVKKDITAVQSSIQPDMSQQETPLFDTIGDKTHLTQSNITVGISFSGTLQNPTFKMFSTPGMPEADIISYLIFNKPQREISTAQASIMFQATNELINFIGGSRQDVKLSLTETLKLDKFGLKQNPKIDPTRSNLENSIFVVGKQLSKRLYAEYSLTMLDNASAINLRYLAGKNLTLEANASSQSVGADILFIFEH